MLFNEHGAEHPLRYSMSTEQSIHSMLFNERGAEHVLFRVFLFCLCMVFLILFFSADTFMACGILYDSSVKTRT